MACRLLGAKAFSEQMLVKSQLEPKEPMAVKL